MEDRTLNVAVIDDESDIHFIFDIHFEKEIAENKIKLFYYINGQDCLNSIVDTNNENKISLLICDINMPVMDGFTLLENLKQKDYNLNIIMASAYVTKDYIDKAKDLGAKYFVPKPLDFEQIKKIIFNKDSF